jgi:hypothetical protein
VPVRPSSSSSSIFATCARCAQCLGFQCARTANRT